MRSCCRWGNSGSSVGTGGKALSDIPGQGKSKAIESTVASFRYPLDKFLQDVGHIRCCAGKGKRLLTWYVQKDTTISDIKMCACVLKAFPVRSPYLSKEPLRLVSAHCIRSSLDSKSHRAHTGWDLRAEGVVTAQLRCLHQRMLGNDVGEGASSAKDFRFR